jgi:predicted RND superfamily exporter protein
VFNAGLALLPTVLGWLWMMGLLAIFGIRFDVANIVALPLVLGIGIAFGVHIMHRATEAPTIGSHKVSVEDIIRGTGGAIMVAALTTIVGFAGLMLGEYGGMISLGLVMVIGVTCTLAATVLVLPAILLLVRRAE